MYRSESLVKDETYHIFNRGAHKRNIFASEKDYERFSILLHLANNKKPLHLSHILEKYKKRSTEDIFDTVETDHSLVDVFAYTLMPNHFHLALRQKEEKGITLFMKKLMTAYAMYFNIKYNHSGVLFQGRFKSRHVPTESYLRYLFAYIHLNPLELIAKDWKEKGISDKTKAQRFLNQYKYSSYADYKGAARPKRKIIAKEIPITMKNKEDALEELLNLVANDPFAHLSVKDGP